MLKKVKGEKSNMYRFVSDTWNPVRGKCPYDCLYCYVGKWGNKQKPLFLDRSYLKDQLGNGRFIFICSGCDLFHPDIPIEWINAIKEHTMQYPGNKYLWHTKNPYRLVSLIEPGPSDIACVTIESNKGYPSITKAPLPIERITYLNEWEGKRMITVEPILDFDLDSFVGMIHEANPVQVNIGADSGGNHLPEPPKEKVIEFIAELEKFTTVHRKANLDRLLKPKAAKKAL
jgi:DNA repair photolyase